MTKRLILLTASFPYGKGETFLENEIHYLAEAFQEVILVCPQTSEETHRAIPSNCLVSFYDKELSKSDKLKAVLGLFEPMTRKEIEIIQKTYQLKFSKGILSILLISLYQAKKIANFLQEKHLNGNVKKQETVFYSYWCDDTALALALLKGRNKELKCISRTHGWDVYFNVHPLKYLPFRHFIAEKLDGIFSISDKGKSEIKNTWKVSDLNNIYVSRLGVEKQINQGKEKSSVFTLVSCSNVIPLKRVHLIAQAVLACKDPIRWIHFGDGKELKSIQDTCLPEKKIQHDISFRGRVSNEEILSFYQSNFIDAFINVSTSEGVPVSIMEAMSFGIPCIATNVGGNSEIVSDENGVLLDANPSLKDIQMAFKSVLNDLGKRKKALQTWEEKYDAEKNYLRFIEMVKSV
jgi:glycosyltransferase involved in cell wall biosynthesis